MRPINIVTANHGESPVSLEDLITYLVCAFESLGIFINISPHIAKGETNLIIECFDDAIAEVITSSIDSGTRVIVIASEHITGNTFNDFNVVDSPQYSNRPYWDMRYRAFRKVADKCLAIWCLSESTHNSCQELYGNKVSTIPYGYVDGYARVVQRPDRFKDIDILFTGGFTQRRSEILGRFRALGCSVRQCGPNLPSFIRENVVSRAKVSLGISQSEDWNYKSNLRTYYHLVNSSFIATERLEDNSPLDPYCEIVAKEDYVRYAIETVRSGTYSNKAKLSLEKFADEMPLRPQFVEFLIRSLVYD